MRLLTRIIRGFGVSVQVSKVFLATDYVFYAMVRSGVILWLVYATSRSATFFFKASISASEEFVCVVFSLVAGRLIHEILYITSFNVSSPRDSSSHFNESI